MSGGPSRSTEPPKPSPAPHQPARAPKPAEPIAAPAGFTPESMLELQRSIGNSAVVAMMGRAGAAGDDGRAPTIMRKHLGAQPGLYLDEGRVPALVGATSFAASGATETVHRKVGNLPTQVYASGAMASIKAKVSSKNQKQLDFEAIQAQLSAYNAETGNTREDLGRHIALLAEIRRLVVAWCDQYGKTKSADLVHAKQRYMAFELKGAIDTEEKANIGVVPDPPKGAEGGVKMPGMRSAPVRAPVPAPPPSRPEVKSVAPLTPAPLSVPSSPPPPPSSPAPRPGHRLPPPLPGRGPAPAPPRPEVKGRVLPPPLPAEIPGVVELTAFQRDIQRVHATLAAKANTTETDIAAWVFIDELNRHVYEFGDSVSSVKDKLKLEKIIQSIDGGDQGGLARLLEIPVVEEKDSGIAALQTKLDDANRAIAALGAITPKIAEKFASAAVNTGRIATAKGLTGLAVGVGLGAVPVPGLGHAFNLAKALRTVRSTIMHIRRLQEIQVEALRAGNKDLVDMLDYIIAKKQSKKYKAGVGGIPFASAVSTVGFKMKGVWKIATGTRGKGREAASVELIETATGGGKSAAGAQLTIMELVDDMAEYQEVILGGSAGAAILARKMASA